MCLYTVAAKSSPPEKARGYKVVLKLKDGYAPLYFSRRTIDNEHIRGTEWCSGGTIQYLSRVLGLGRGRRRETWYEAGVHLYATLQAARLAYQAAAAEWRMTGKWEDLISVKLEIKPVIVKVEGEGPICWGFERFPNPNGVAPNDWRRRWRYYKVLVYKRMRILEEVRR